MTPIAKVETQGYMIYLEINGKRVHSLKDQHGYVRPWVEELANNINAALGSFIPVEDARQALEALEMYIKAQGQMLDRWSESDKKVRGTLWINLHRCETEAKEAAARLRKALGV